MLARNSHAAASPSSASRGKAGIGDSAHLTGIAHTSHIHSTSPQQPVGRANKILYAMPP
jgi:hypothetical protein